MTTNKNLITTDSMSRTKEYFMQMREEIAIKNKFAEEELMQQELIQSQTKPQNGQNQSSESDAEKRMV